MSPSFSTTPGAAPPPAPTTLRELNVQLAAANLSLLSATALQRLLEREPRERLLRALARAGTGDPNARTYLMRVIEAAGAPAGAMPPRLRLVSPPPPVAAQPMPGDRELPVVPPPLAAAPAGVENAGMTTPAAVPVSRPNPIPPAPADRASSPVGVRAPTRSASGAARSPDSPASPPAKEDPSRPRSLHVYGQKAALCFEADTTREGWPTVLLEAALATAPRQYDWAGKIRLQLTRLELPVVAAVLLGGLPRCEYKNHGPDHHKGFSLEDQGATFFVRVFAKDQPVRAVPMIPEEAFPVAALVLRQLQAATPGLEGAVLLAVLQGTVGRMKPVGGRGS